MSSYKVSRLIVCDINKLEMNIKTGYYQIASSEKPTIGVFFRTGDDYTEIKSGFPVRHMFPSDGKCTEDTYLSNKRPYSEETERSPNEIVSTQTIRSDLRKLIKKAY